MNPLSQLISQLASSIQGKGRPLLQQAEKQIQAIPPLHSLQEALQQMTTGSSPLSSPITPQNVSPAGNGGVGTGSSQSNYPGVGVQNGAQTIPQTSGTPIAPNEFTAPMSYGWSQSGNSGGTGQGQVSGNELIYPPAANAPSTPPATFIPLGGGGQSPSNYAQQYGPGQMVTAPYRGSPTGQAFWYPSGANNNNPLPPPWNVIQQ